MKPIRFHISRLMIVAAIIAVNLAAVRVLFQSRRGDVLLGGALLWALLEVGVFGAVRNRGRRRPFWLGFVGFGAVAALSCLAAARRPHSVAASPWTRYMGWSAELIERTLEASYRRNGNALLHEILELTAFSAYWVIPILITAVAGGLLVQWSRRGLSRTPEQAGLPSTASPWSASG